MDTQLPTLECTLCLLRCGVPTAFDPAGLCASAMVDPASHLSYALHALVGALVFSAALPPCSAPPARASLLRLCAAVPLAAPGALRRALGGALGGWCTACGACASARAGGVAEGGGGALSLFALASRHVLPLLPRLPRACAAGVCDALWRALLALPPQSGARPRLARQAFAAVLCGWLGGAWGGPCAAAGEEGGAPALGAMGDALACALPRLFPVRGSGAPAVDLGVCAFAWLRAAALGVAGWGGAPLARRLASRLVAAALAGGGGSGDEGLAAARAALGFALASGALGGEDLLALGGGAGARARDAAGAPIAVALALALDACGAALALGADDAPLAALAGGGGALAALLAQPLPFQEAQCACPGCCGVRGEGAPPASAAARQDACLRLLLVPPAVRARPAWALLPRAPAAPPAAARKRARSADATFSPADWSSLPADCLHRVLDFLAPAPARDRRPPARPPAAPATNAAPPAFLRDHVRLCRAMGALAGTCGAWRDALAHMPWLFSALFHERWELHGECASEAGAGLSGRPLYVVAPPPLATAALPAARLRRSAPLPPGHVRCLCGPPPRVAPYAPAPPTHEWATIYRARAAAQGAALREERRAAATRAQRLGRRGAAPAALLNNVDRWAAGRAVGAGEERGAGAAGAIFVCDVCTCAALFPSKAAAVLHLRTHHGLSR